MDGERSPSRGYFAANADRSRPHRIRPAPVVLFDIDRRGKPKAARFGMDHAKLAIKAASQLHLEVLANEPPEEP
jgi:hypothetical protein